MSHSLKRKDQLFPTPQKPPQYSVVIESEKGVKYSVADPKITRVALALMDMQACLGGAASHWGGPSAFAEIVSALYAVVFHEANKKGKPWQDLFHIINDAGHCENGLYALKANYNQGINFKDLQGFRSIDSVLTGHGEHHLFPEGVYLSNGPLGSTLAQAQGLSMADHLAGLKRMTVVLMSDGACMEGEAKEAFSSIPGFFKKNQINPFVVIVSDNNTKLSGRIDEDSFCQEPFFKSLKTAGWDYKELKGHNLKACINEWEKVLLSISNKPCFIRAKTIKGYGVKSTTKSASGGHGFPLKNTRKLEEFLKEIYGALPLPPEFQSWMELLKEQSEKKKPQSSGLKKVKVQEGISRAMIFARENKNWPVISVSADLQGSTGVQAFRKKFPEFSFDVGVAESNMVSLGAGFSKQGFIPVVDTFTQFGVTKGALPLFMANLSRAPVIAVFSHAGLQDAADGASHQSLTYLAQTSSLPKTDVYCLSSSAEAEALMSQAIESFACAYEKGHTPRSKIFFLGRETFPPSYLPENYSYKLDQAQVVYSEGEGGLACTLWAFGPLVGEALSAGKKLVSKGWKVCVAHASSVNRPDIETLLFCLKQTRFNLLTLEDHHLLAGAGAIVAHQLMLMDVKVRMRSLGVQADFGRSAYKSQELYKLEKLTAEEVIQFVQENFKRN